METHPSPTEPDGAELGCLSCGTAGSFTSPDLEPVVGSVIICGQCAEIHVLGVRQIYNRNVEMSMWLPYLRRPVLEELEAIREQPGVRTILQAFEQVQIERRMRAAAHKGPRQGKGLQLVDGGRLELKGQGPDYRGPHLL